MVAEASGMRAAPAMATLTAWPTVMLPASTTTGSHSTSASGEPAVRDTTALTFHSGDLEGDTEVVTLELKLELVERVAARDLERDTDLVALALAERVREREACAERVVDAWGLRVVEPLTCTVAEPLLLPQTDGVLLRHSVGVTDMLQLGHPLRDTEGEAMLEALVDSHPELDVDGVAPSVGEREVYGV